MIGTSVGSYRITAKVSIGGMGAVYRAEHMLIGRAAAVKILHPELSGSRDIVNRFFNEAKATTQIQHPGIVEVFDFGYMPSGHAYLIMEFLEGMSLARRIKTRGRMSEGDAAMLLRAMCSALGAAHAKGIVHRDLKPDNIFLVPDADAATGERPKILDFGIAKLTDIGLADSATKTGAVMGTPTYMSPEQCKGTGEVDHRADLYSLGCIFYELVCGRPPFVNRGAGELIGAHLYRTPEPPTKHCPSLSPEGEALIMALLAKEPSERPQTMKELANRLLKIAEMLGWVTSSSPTGLTSPRLAELLSAEQLGTPTTANHKPPTDSLTCPTPLRAAAARAAADAAAVVAADGDYSISVTPAPIQSDHDSDPILSDKPTTLSGAASQSVISHVDLPRPKRRVGTLAAIVVAAAALVMVGVGVTVMVGSHHGDAEGEGGTRAAATAPVPAPAPTPAPTAPTPAPTPTAQVPVPPPAPVAPPIEPTPAPVPEAIAVTPTPPPPVPAPTVHVAVKPPVQHPVAHPPSRVTPTTPTTTPIPKPTPTEPKKPEPVKPTNPLIETDI